MKEIFIEMGQGLISKGLTTDFTVYTSCLHTCTLIAVIGKKKFGAYHYPCIGDRDKTKTKYIDIIKCLERLRKEVDPNQVVLTFAKGMGMGGTPDHDKEFLKKFFSKCEISEGSASASYAQFKDGKLSGGNCANLNRIGLKGINGAIDLSKFKASPINLPIQLFGKNLEIKTTNSCSSSDEEEKVKGDDK